MVLFCHEAASGCITLNSGTGHKCLNKFRMVFVLHSGTGHECLKWLCT